MIDASDKSLDENIAITSKVVEYAKKYNVSVEGEIGTLEENEYSNIEECKIYVASTGVTALAPSIGNVHGIYKEKPNLNFELVKEIKEDINIPIVLHGASGIDNNDLKKLINLGISKININTALQQAWSKGVKEYLNINTNEYDPRKIISSGKNNMVKCIRELISIFNNN